MGIDLPPSPVTTSRTDAASSVTDVDRMSHTLETAPPPSVATTAPERPDRPERVQLPALGSAGGHLGSGPGPGYEPDEAERRRAARGEAQAQFLPFGGTGTDGEEGLAGPTEKFLAGSPGGTPRRRNST